MRGRWVVFAMCVLASVSLLWAGAGDGAWLKNVPEKDRARTNPLAGDAQAPAAGGKLFRQHCVACHGEDGTGKGKKPSLRSEHVRGATEGELEWLLTNGSLKNGMPSWSRLPEAQRWQIVSYLKTLH
jgi:mono/diheme cytochrome c family protein